LTLKDASQNSKISFVIISRMIRCARSIEFSVSRPEVYKSFGALKECFMNPDSSPPLESATARSFLQACPNRFFLFEQRYEMRDRLWLDGPHGAWIAFDRLLEREVVVNIPYAYTDRASFLQMARNRCRLRHANLLPVYDMGISKDGMPFFTERYVEATALGRLLRDREDKAFELTLVRLISYLLDACKAVVFLHANGFLHLALNPWDVIVARQFQEVFVGGLDSQSPVSVDSKLTRSEVLSGVPAYMAPEQADPKRLGMPDALTDVYGLGGILFEILYDKPPNAEFDMREIVTELASRRGPPNGGKPGARAAQCRALAQKLEPVCLRALDSDRTTRQVSVSAFMREVEQCMWGFG